MSRGSQVATGGAVGGRRRRAGVGVQEPETECWSPTAPAKLAESSTGEGKNLVQNERDAGCFEETETAGPKNRQTGFSLGSCGAG